jgi:hypothetical protein
LTKIPIGEAKTPQYFQGGRRGTAKIGEPGLHLRIGKCRVVLVVQLIDDFS